MSAEASFAAVRTLGGRAVTRSDRDAVDAVCRSIDVRRQFDPDPAAAADILGALLANDGEPDGYGLKCANTVLKALELRDDIPGAVELRMRALGIVERGKP